MRTTVPATEPVGDHGCQVTSFLAVAADNWVIVDFNGVVDDTDSYTDLGEDPQVITIPAGQGGKYLITAQCNTAFADAAVGDNGIGLVLDFGGPLPIGQARQYGPFAPGTVAQAGLELTAVRDLSAGATVTLSISHSNAVEGSIDFGVVLTLQRLT